ncbi:MAG TPA: hypothetical protein VLG47_07780 [Candidatus Saccharimonadales bacterium]|nr:hypothetical protein [Candidatus Saccharimonadales bacterium]
MKQKFLLRWITMAGIIGIAFGVFYAIYGLDGLPIYQKFVPAQSFEGWSRGLYGSVFVGFSVMLLLLGRLAIKKNDKELTKILLCGILAWLTFEAVVSVIYKVYINVAVDILLISFLSYPLLKSIRK